MVTCYLRNIADPTSLDHFERYVDNMRGIVGAERGFLRPLHIGSRP